MPYSLSYWQRCYINQNKSEAEYTTEVYITINYRKISFIFVVLTSLLLLFCIGVKTKSVLPFGGSGKYYGCPKNLSKHGIAAGIGREETCAHSSSSLCFLYHFVTAVCRTLVDISAAAISWPLPLPSGDIDCFLGSV